MTEEEKKQRHKEAMRKYYQRNKARLNAYATEYKTAHPESVQKRTLNTGTRTKRA